MTLQFCLIKEHLPKLRSLLKIRLPILEAARKILDVKKKSFLQVKIKIVMLILS